SRASLPGVAFFTAYSISGFCASPSKYSSTAFRVSIESQAGLAQQLLEMIRRGTVQHARDRLIECDISSVCVDEPSRQPGHRNMVPAQPGAARTRVLDKSVGHEQN